MESFDSLKAMAPHSSSSLPMSHSNSERLYLRGQFRTEKKAYLTLARSEERRDRTGVVQSKQSSVLHTGVEFFNRFKVPFLLWKDY